MRGLMSDEEWAFFEPFVVEKGPGRGRRPRDHRRVLGGVFWIARTGTAWRDLHSLRRVELGLSAFRRWTLAGTWVASRSVRITGMALVRLHRLARLRRQEDEQVAGLHAGLDHADAGRSSGPLSFSSCRVSSMRHSTQPLIKFGLSWPRYAGLRVRDYV